MKRFGQFIVEEKMSYDRALQILGLPRDFTPDQLKKAYRTLAVAHHPDKHHGDDTLMKDINAANDVLSKSGGSSNVFGNKSREQFWKDIEEKNQFAASIATATFMKYWKPEAFTKHFSTVFGQAFTQTKDEHIGYTRHGGPGVTHRAEWTSADRNIVLSLSDYIDYTTLRDARLLSADQAEEYLRQVITTSILYNRKDVKLTQGRYTFDSRANLLSDPESLFPAHKLKKQAGKSKAREFSRRDAYLTFEKELRASVSGEWVYVPVGEWKVSLWRSVLMRQAMWSFHSFRRGKEQGRCGVTHFIMEDEQHMNMLFDQLKGLQRNPPETLAQMQSAVDNAAKYLKDHK